MIENITHNGEFLALIVRAGYDKPGISFFTPDDLSLQLGYMHHPAEKQILPHVHNSVPRQVHYAQEVLFIRRGKLRVDFYTSKQQYIESRELGAGDVILLATGGHGFQVLEELEMFEVKQGPYIGEACKTRFEGITAKDAKLP